jgi:membrane protein implicated in regulation of membrane protease activity
MIRCAPRRGNALAGALLTFMALLPLAILAMTVSMSVYGQPVALAPAAIFVALSTISLLMLVRYLKETKERRDGSNP